MRIIWQLSYRSLIKQHRSLVSNSAAIRPDLDFDFLLNPSNIDAIRQNIAQRKQVGNIDEVNQRWTDLISLIAGGKKLTSEAELRSLWDDFYSKSAEIPNKTHPDAPIGDETQARRVKLLGCETKFDFTPRTAEEIGQKTGSLRTDLGFVCADKAYAFLGEFVQLERAFVRAIRSFLLQKNFCPVVVPDVLKSEIPTGCGLMQRTDKNILYRLEELSKSSAGDPHDRLVLSGTGEMGVASYLAGKTFQLDQLPQRYVTVSRCYRPEVAQGRLSHGIYRVHEFVKVEMFAVTADESGAESDEILEEFRSNQEEIFNHLGLYCQVLDMPSQELGAAAYRKYDIEAWMPGRKAFGEISSASNCLDYQSRRLGIKYTKPNGSTKYVHTVNGTACAVPRTIIALVEQRQKKNLLVSLPPFLMDFISRRAQPVLAHSQPQLKVELLRQKSIFNT